MIKDGDTAYFASHALGYMFCAALILGAVLYVAIRVAVRLFRRR